MPNRASAVAADLVERFRRQRPVRAGSLLVTLFGDSIMPRGGAIALGSLITLGALFGLNERLVRTASARLAQEGWLAARRIGKHSEYRLSDGGRERFAEATERIYGDPANEGSGRWTLIVLPPAPVAQRRRLRQELGWQGFGELGSGVFAHPELPARALAWQMREANLPDHTLVFVVVLERDELSEQAAQRRGTPHAIHPHGLLARGLQVLEELFPGFTNALLARGAQAGDIGLDVAVEANGRRFARTTLGSTGVGASRLLIEAELRQRVRGWPRAHRRRSQRASADTRRWPGNRCAIAARRRCRRRRNLARGTGGRLQRPRLPQPGLAARLGV